MQVAMVPLQERALKKGARPGSDPRPSELAERIDVRAVFPPIMATVSICGAASNAGKTWLCEEVLRGLRAQGRRTLALKITRTHLGACPRGIDTCGTCDSLAGDWELVRERERLDVPRKDTGRYFAAGADHVLWLLVKPSAIRAGVLAALAEVPPGCILVAEGNSFRDYASADVTLLALSRDGEIKASASHVLDRVDAYVRDRRLPDPTPTGRRSQDRAPRAAEGPAATGIPLLAPRDAWAFVQDRLARGPLR
jgi:molybdopterin-guanine dinucleotide biosynthesis protein